MQNWIFEIKNQLIIVLTYVFRGMNKYIFPLLFFVCFTITNAAIPKEKYLFVEIPDKDLGRIHKGHHDNMIFWNNFFMKKVT